MVIGAAGHQVKALFQQGRCHGLGILHHIVGIGFERRLHRFLQTDCLGCNHMFQRTALGTGEDTGIQLFGKFLPGQNHTAAGTPEGLVGGGSDDVCIGNGAHMRTAGNQTGNVSHIHHENSTDFVGNIRKHLEINGSGIGGRTGNDPLGITLFCHIPDLIIVNEAGFVIDIIRNNIVVFAGQVGRAAMGQVATVI